MGVPLDLTTDPRTLKTSPPFPSLTFGGFATNRFVQRLIWKGGESLPSDMSLRVPAVTLVFGFSRRKPPSVEPDGKTSGKLGRPLTRLSPRHFFLFSGRRNVAQRRKERNVGESSAVQLPGLRLTLYLPVSVWGLTPRVLCVLRWLVVCSRARNPPQTPT